MNGSAAWTVSPRRNLINSFFCKERYIWDFPGKVGGILISDSLFSYFRQSMIKYAPVCTSPVSNWAHTHFYLTIVFYGLNSFILSVFSSFFPSIYHSVNIVPAHDALTSSAAAPAFHRLTWRQIDETLHRHLLRVICISCEVEQGLLCIRIVPLSSSSVICWFTLVHIQLNSSLDKPFFTSQLPDGLADRWRDRKMESRSN